jgi:hypothetical protein
MRTTTRARLTTGRNSRLASIRLHPPPRSGASRAEAVSHPGMRWDEYKLLQDKFDRIGDFKFRVKTWVASLAGLFVVGSEAVKAGWWGAACGTALVPLFWYLESYYKQLESALGKRLRVLERELQKGEFLALPQASKKRMRKSVGPRTVEAIDQAFSHERRGPMRFLPGAHVTFYVVLLAVPLLAFWLRHNSGNATETPICACCSSSDVVHSAPPGTTAVSPLVTDESTEGKVPQSRSTEEPPAPDASVREGAP